MDCAICTDAILPMSESAATNRQYNRQYSCGRSEDLFRVTTPCPTPGKGGGSSIPGYHEEILWRHPEFPLYQSGMSRAIE